MALKRVYEIMVQLRTINNFAHLGKLNRLDAICPDETRWSGKFEMVRQYIRIEKCILKIKKVDKYFPSPALRRCLKSVLVRFCNFESIANHLQLQGLMLIDARIILDSVCDDYPRMSKYLSADA